MEGSRRSETQAMPAFVWRAAIPKTIVFIGLLNFHRATKKPDLPLPESLTGSEPGRVDAGPQLIENKPKIDKNIFSIHSNADGSPRGENKGDDPPSYGARHS